MVAKVWALRGDVLKLETFGFRVSPMQDLEDLVASL